VCVADIMMLPAGMSVSCWIVCLAVATSDPGSNAGIDYGDGNAGAPIVQHQRAHVQFVVHVVRNPEPVITTQPGAHTRSNVGGRCTGE